MLEVVFVFNPEAEFSLISSERANQKREQATRPSVLRGEEVGPPRPPLLERLPLAGKPKHVPEASAAVHIHRLALGRRKEARGVFLEN